MWYNQAVDSGGGVGFWAELYVIEDGNYETFFRNMPPIGLGTVADLVPFSDHRRRLGLSEQGNPASEDGPSGRMAIGEDP